MKTVTPRDLAERLGSDPLDLIDVRTPAEYREVHVTGARSVPLDQLSDTPFEPTPIYVLCKSGQRATKAAKCLETLEGVEPIVVEGGTDACVAAGLPVERGKAVMSLERQVRIVAGGLVALGVGLSFISPWFLILPGFVGCGLVFAGVTDFCGMGLLLAKLPWNR